VASGQSRRGEAPRVRPLVRVMSRMCSLVPQINKPCSSGLQLCKPRRECRWLDAARSSSDFLSLSLLFR
jgi:hypothetical protein